MVTKTYSHFTAADCEDDVWGYSEQKDTRFRFVHYESQKRRQLFARIQVSYKKKERKNVYVAFIVNLQAVVLAERRQSRKETRER